MNQQISSYDNQRNKKPRYQVKRKTSTVNKKKMEKETKIQDEV